VPGLASVSPIPRGIGALYKQPLPSDVAVTLVSWIPGAAMLDLGSGGSESGGIARDRVCAVMSAKHDELLSTGYEFASTPAEYAAIANRCCIAQDAWDCSLVLPRVGNPFQEIAVLFSAITSCSRLGYAPPIPRYYPDDVAARMSVPFIRVLEPSVMVAPNAVFEYLLERNMDIEDRLVKLGPGDRAFEPLIRSTMRSIVGSNLRSPAPCPKPSLNNARCATPAFWFGFAAV
jgi:hypothetical protein